MPESATEFVYEIDAADRIQWVDPAWLRFAHENEAPELTGEAVLGRSVYDFLDGGEVRHLYAILFAAARRGRALRVPFRCDAPDRRRYMELRIEPVPETRLRLVGSLLREEPRPTVPLLEPGTPRDDAMVAVCSWCKRVRTAPETWEEVEDAVRRLGLFDARALPRLTHGICRDCEARVAGLLGSPADGEAGATG